MNKSLLAIGLSALLAWTAPALAQTPPGAPAAKAVVSIADASLLLREARADLDAKDTAGFTALVGALEEALANPDTPQIIDGSPVFLFNGLSENLLVQMYLKTPDARELAARSPRVIEDPYPTIAFILGFHYNEIRQTDQALRVLNAGLQALEKHLEPSLADIAPLLHLEIGATHNIAGRWQEAHDTYKAALNLPGDSHEARMYRGMGFSLIELNRLDEAQAAFDQSLKIEPNNASAKAELAYIAQLRRGGPKQAIEVIVSPLATDPPAR